MKNWTYQTKIAAAQGLAFLALAFGGGLALDQSNHQSLSRETHARLVQAANAHKSNIQGCGRSNKVRAYLRFRSAHLKPVAGDTPEEAVKRSALLFPILDCEATYRAHGVEVPLPQAAQDAYILKVNTQDVGGK